MISCRRCVAAVARLLGELVEALPLHVEDLAERLGDLLVHAAEVVALELVATAAAQALHEVAHAHHLVAVPVAEPLLHHPAQGGVQVAVVQQVVGDLLEHGVGVEVEPDLRAVPLRVPEPRPFAIAATVPSRGRVRPPEGLQRGMRVEIWSDVACPWCYVGTQRFGRAVEETGVEVDVVYRSFELDPRVPTGEASPPLVDYLERKFGDRSIVQAAHARLTSAAPSSGSTSGGAGCGAPTPSTPTGCWRGRSTSTALTDSAR